MYVVEEPIAINWELISEPGKLLTQDLFDIITISPDGTATYIVNPTTNWIPPYDPGNGCDPATKGNVTYTFTVPEVSPGRWEVKLVTGNANDYKILDILGIYGICAPPLASVEINSLAIEPYQVSRQCAFPVVFMENQVRWRAIDSVGKGPRPDTVIISGYKTAFNLSTDLAIISTIDGAELEYYPSALLAVPYQSRTAFVECDPSTGVCFIGTRSYYFGGNLYKHYWTDDFVTYTQCSGMSTAIGVLGAWHDSNLKMWFIQYWGDTWVSLEGKHWVKQQYNRQPSVSLQDTTQLNDFLHTGMYKEGDTKWAFCANHAERGYHISNDGVPQAPMALNEFLQDFSIDIAPYYGVFFGGNPNNPGLDAVVGWEGNVYMMSTSGQICRAKQPQLYGSSIDPDDDFWVAIAADQSNADTNELLDIPFSTWRSFSVINDVFWCCRDQGGANKWYRYDDGSGNGGEPVGHGWVMDNSGPFGTRRIGSSSTTAYRKRWPEQRHVQIFNNVTDPPYDAYILFDVGLNE
jgi:hypothetical protein